MWQKLRVDPGLSVPILLVRLWLPPCGKKRDDGSGT